jgi:hypothetical protein
MNQFTDKTFCEECRKDVKYNVETVLIKGKLKDKEYMFIGKKAICSDCGSEVYVADIEDENLETLYDMYHQKTNNKKGGKIMKDVINMIDKYLNDIYFLKSFKSNVKEYITLENHYLELITILEQIKYEIERRMNDEGN